MKKCRYFLTNFDGREILVFWGQSIFSIFQISTNLHWSLEPYWTPILIAMFRLGADVAKRLLSQCSATKTTAKQLVEMICERVQRQYLGLDGGLAPLGCL